MILLAIFGIVTEGRIHFGRNRSVLIHQKRFPTNPNTTSW
jgi:hypothetical protein